MRAQLQRAGAECLDAEAAAELTRYLTFVDLWLSAHTRAMGRLHSLLRLIPGSDAELVGLFGRVLRAVVSEISPPSPEGQTVSAYERNVHNYMGYGNDIIYAMLRALNEGARLGRMNDGRPLRGEAQRVAFRRFSRASEIASEVNGLEYLLDQISFGELAVGEVSVIAEPFVRLEFVDVRRSLMRILAIRRNLILRMNRVREPRYVREMLKASVGRVSADALDHYEREYGFDPVEVDERALLERGEALLTFVEAEDDMLMLAAGDDPRAAIRYLLGASLAWFHQVADAIQRSAVSRRKTEPAVSIPTERIVWGGQHSDFELVERCLEDLISKLPVRSHFDLVRRPYVSTRAGVLALPSGTGGLWTTTVREGLVAGGGIGDRYGWAWEKFYADLFKQSHWTVLGEGLKLRRDGRLITDLDLLLQKGDLVLAVQIKALIGSGVSPYDHWRNRKTIEWGCLQAKAAGEFLREHPGWLIDVAGRELARQVKHIQPVVLTNVDFFDGWRFEEVPVMGEVGRKAIVRGARVDFSDESGTDVDTLWITRPEDLTTERILWSLDNPVELHISQEIPETRYDNREVAGLTVSMPDFVLRDMPASRSAVSG
ncbi:hypothetical protein [Brevundimonas bullata]